MKGLFLFFLVFLFSYDLSAGQKKILVLLNLPPVFNRFEKEAESYLKRELREIPDVALVEKAPYDVFVSVVPAPVNTQDGDLSGIALSYFFDHKSGVMHNVKVSPPGDLKLMCQKVIAELDSYLLEPLRK